MPLRGRTLAEATKDAVSYYNSLSLDEQKEIANAWVVSNRQYEDLPIEQWYKGYFVDFYKRPLKYADEVGKVCIEYTGGGISIAFMYTDEHIYYVLDNADGLLGKYDDSEESDLDGMCMNLLSISDDPSEWTPDEREIYGRLKQALIDENLWD
jgi:hypothetical protein